MNREQRFAALAGTERFDLVVVGGGATGLGVALDAALRGFSVALFESHDFAGGTSSRATKLLHGGVRYLAQGNVALVREALAERTTVMAIAPHLAQPLPFVMPSHQWWQTPFYGIGLKLYDVLAGRAGLGTTEFLDRAQTLAALPGVNPEGLKGGVRYWDGQFDDARLAIALARTAEATGALVFNHAEVSAIVADGDGHALTVDDQVGGARTACAHVVWSTPPACGSTPCAKPRARPRTWFGRARACTWWSIASSWAAIMRCWCPGRGTAACSLRSLGWAN